jgi:hypothetical protein
MGEISAISALAVAINQSQIQERVAIDIMRLNAQAEQAIAGMVIQNAQQVEVLSGNIVGRGINLYA